MKASVLKQVKRAAGVCLCGAMIAASLAGCGTGAGSGDDSAAKDEAAADESAQEVSQAADEGEFSPRLDTEAEVTINVVGNYDNFPSLEQVALDFNEYYPNVMVNYSKVDDYANMQDMIITDNPEVDICLANNTWVKNSEAAKANLTDLADESLGFDLTALSDGVIESAKSGESLYRLPIFSVCNGLIVNKTLLEENGLTVPTNYDEFVSCCESLKAAGFTPIYGYDADGNNKCSQGIYSSMVMTLAAKQDGDHSVSEALNTGDREASSVYLEGLKKEEEFAALGYYSKEANAGITDSYEGAILRFFEGDVPFLSASTETMSGTAKRESMSANFTANPFEYTFIATPLGESGAYAYINSNAGLALNKNGANFDYAAEFLRFYCNAKELNISADIKGMLSTSSDAESAECFPDLELSNSEYVSYISDFYLESVPSNTINDIIRIVGDDGVSAEDALAQYADIYAGFEAEQ